jgi:uncharacterized protein YutE (UPF0331/DUF86 family)/predicted nucleotidyltransferase
MKLADIENRLATLAEALAADGVRLACVFGSVLERPSARDVDLGVWFEEYSFERYLRALELAQQVLGTGRVDLVVLNRVSAPLKLRALLEGRLLYAATPTAPVELAAEALWEYEDYRWFMAEYRRQLSRRCQEGLSVAARRMDRERVEGYLSTLDAAMAEFRRLRQRFASFEEFRADVDTRELCVHYLRIALESVLDVCRHFLGAVGVGLSDLEAANWIELAGDKGLLERTFASRIRGMAGMRNAIVHVYWRLDYHAIHRAVTEQVSDFDEFARQVRAYLEQDGRK